MPSIFLLVSMVSLVNHGRGESGSDTTALRRIVAIPDIHGDSEVMLQAIALAEPFHPERDQLIFTGDFVDRGPEPQRCYDQGEELGANVYPGLNVTRLMGNHEWVNIMGVGPGHNFAGYVPSQDLRSFGGWQKRQESFRKDGTYGKMIREKFGVIAVLPRGVEFEGSEVRTVFVHAGLTKKIIQQYSTVEDMRDKGEKMLRQNQLDNSLFRTILQTRKLAQGRQEKSVCREVKEILRWAKAARLVVGHTPTPLLPGGEAGKAIIRCQGQFVLFDVAMSRWMGGGSPAALILEYQDPGSGEDDEKATVSRIYMKYPNGVEEAIPVTPVPSEESWLLNEWRSP